MRIRTADPLLAKQMLYQLSYTPSEMSERRMENEKANSYAACDLARMRTGCVSANQVSSIELGCCLRLSPRARTITCLTESDVLGVDLSTFTSRYGR